MTAATVKARAFDRPDCGSASCHAIPSDCAPSPNRIYGLESHPKNLSVPKQLFVKMLCIESLIEE